MAELYARAAELPPRVLWTLAALALACAALWLFVALKWSRGYRHEDDSSGGDR